MQAQRSPSSLNGQRQTTGPGRSGLHVEGATRVIDLVEAERLGAARPGTYLPTAPGDRARDSYFGSQMRWVPVISCSGSLLAAVSLLYFLFAQQPWANVLFIPLLIALCGAAVSVITSTRRRRGDLPSHRKRVASWSPSYIPSVDVFLPTAGEDLQVLRNTYRQVAALEWPGTLTVLVLDDSASSAVRELATEFGFVYATRKNRGHLKKAGNLRFGYEQADGDVIAVFDADFCPRPDYLYELMPYFDEPDVAIVQSPQYFETHAQMNWVQRAAATTQILFYRWIQPSRDRSDAAICVGTCAIYRRQALDAAGGFAQIGHSEDVHTGVNVMEAGYRIRYVPTCVAIGICPDTLGQFLGQQYRWCTGSMSLLFSRRFHSIKLSRMQRLSYYSGFLYYITTAIGAFVIALPPLFMAYFEPSHVHMANYALVVASLAVRLAIVPVITQGRDSLISLARIQSAYSFAHAVALYDKLRGRTDAWVATGAVRSSPTSTRIQRTARVWTLTVQALMWAGIAWRAPHYGYLNYLPLAAFALLNLVVIYPLMAGRTKFPSGLDPMALRRRLKIF